MSKRKEKGSTILKSKKKLSRTQQESKKCIGNLSSETSETNKSKINPLFLKKTLSDSVKKSTNIPANDSCYGKMPDVKCFSTSIYKNAQNLPAIKQTNSLYLDTRDSAYQILATKGYHVLEKVGSGNYAKVYRIINKNNKEMAVKIIDLNQTSKNYRINFLPRELNILSRLRHRNIAQIYEILQSSKIIFIFMEYTPNGTVADFLRNYRAIPEYICRPMFAQIVDALYYMHSLNMAHRDLKLENILIDRYGQPKLTDFSYSLVCQKDSRGALIYSKTFCGSLPYIPPEILKESAYDPRVADIWSLGICLYIMLNDGLPFKFNDISNMLKCQLTKNWKFKTRIASVLSDNAKDLVNKMLEPNVNLRITCKEIQAHPWLKK